MELEEAVLGVLEAPRWRRRLLDRLTGGRTALQVWQELPVYLRGEGDPVSERRAVEAVRAVLDALVTGGSVRRGKVKMTVSLNTKGPRDVLVDVYRAARPSSKPKAARGSPTDYP